MLDATRCEVEKCAVVRTLAKQKEHLQKLLTRRETELEMLKRTQVCRRWPREPVLHPKRSACPMLQFFFPTGDELPSHTLRMTVGTA